MSQNGSRQSQEQKILSVVDSLARLIAELYRIDPNQDFKLTLSYEPKLIKSFHTLCPLLLPMVNDRAELLPQILSQLFLQKMPAGPGPEFPAFYLNAVQVLIDTLPDFDAHNYRDTEIETDVNTETKTAFDSVKAEENDQEAETASAPMPEPQPDAETNPEANMATLQRILAWAFPKEPVLSPWTKRSYTFDAYLPGLHLVLNLGSPRQNVPNSLWLKKENLRLLWIDPELLSQPLKLRSYCLSHCN